MKSVWAATAGGAEPKKSLRGECKTDVLIIGGGLCGVLTAWALRRAGVDCIIVEAAELGGGVSQNTTGKVTAQHGLIYSQIEARLGLEAAGQYLRANLDAVEALRGLAREIPCDWEDKTAYIYSIDKHDKLEREAEVYARMGVEAEWLEEPPLPLRTVGALGMKGQGQFHPLKLLRGAAEGLEIYEHTFVRTIGDRRAETADGAVIRAKKIILATHFPLVNIPGLYALKLYQHRSYAIALDGAGDPGGMFLDEREDGHSFRTYNGLLLVGGGDHRTGKSGGGWEELRKLVQQGYPDAQERYAWATQDCMSLDAMPYIGRHRASKHDLYVATGFNKWGMTGSMVAARMLTELIATGHSEYAALFSPSRPMAPGALATNVLHAVQGIFSFGKRCPHMGCALKWNPREHSWDCPCHGSRFNRAGHIIQNPAKRGMGNP